MSAKLTKAQRESWHGALRRLVEARDYPAALALLRAPAFDPERQATLSDLLTRAREYVADALDAYEHSDGRQLLSEIDAALSPTGGA